MKPPKHGDVRVCFIPEIADHALAIDVADMATAKVVYESLIAVLTAEHEHGRYHSAASIYVQRFIEDEGWDEVDPSKYDDEQIILAPWLRRHIESGRHKPVQYRDGKEPWCPICGLTAALRSPISRLKKD